MNETLNHWAIRAQDMGDRILASLNLAAYAVIGEVHSLQQFDCPVGARWLNPGRALETDMTSTGRAPMVAHWKAGELIARHTEIKSRQIRKTPIFIEPDMRGTGWRGGVQVGSRIVAVSGLPQHHDELLAALMHTAGMNDLAPIFRTMKKVSRDDKTAPLLDFRTGDPVLFMAFLQEVCGGGIEPLNVDDDRDVIWVKREAGDDREYSAIGVTSSRS